MAGPEGTRQLKFREPLGRGGFGTVYLADLRGGQGLMQRVAVKILHSDNPDEREVSARQRDEARLLAQLNHDHIVKVYDLIEVEGRPAVIMEYIDGVDAETWVKKAGAMPPRAALQVMAGVASALNAAFNTESPVTGRPLQAIHRDVKPANVLISTHGAVKVLDFGVARADLDRDAETIDAHAMGTLAFIAPEQWMMGSVTAAVDIYALGLSLLRVLTGQVVERIPLSQERYNARVIELAGLADGPEWPEAWREDLRGLIRKMLSWNAPDRPSAAEVESRCLELADRAPGEGLAVLARRQVPVLVEERRRKYGQTSIILPGDVTMTLNSVVPNTAPTPVALPAPRPAPSGRSIGLIVGAMLGGLLLSLGVVGLGIWLYLRQDAPTPTPAPVVTTSPVVVSGTQRRATTTLPSAPASPTTTSAAAKTSEAAKPATSEAKPRASAEKTTTEKATTSAEPAAPLASFPITLSSVPLGAEVWVDGKKVGTTPMRGLPLTEGAHTVRLIASDGRSADKTINVSERAPGRYIWRADGDTWESGL